MTEKIHYIKSPNLVELPMHGAFGGINSSTGQVAMSIFSERGPLPRLLEFDIDSDGNSFEVSRESKDGIIRNVTATLYFDINTAIAMRSWLDEQIAEFVDKNPGLFEEEKDDSES